MNNEAEKSRDELLEELVQEKLDGTSYSEIRTRLSVEGMQVEEIFR